MKQTWFYSLKVWATAVLAGPLGVLLYFHFINDTELANFDGYMLMAILGAVFSIPSLLLLWFASYGLSIIDLPVGISKTILSIAGVALTFAATFFLSAIFKWVSDFFITSSYALVIVAGIWGYKLERAEQVIIIAD